MSKPIFSSLDNLSLRDIEAEADLIPLLTTEDEEALEREDLPDSVPILPLKNTVLFPGVVIPITVGRDKSIQLIKEANKGDKVIGVVAQKDQLVENPSVADVYALGTVAQILRVLTMPDGNTTIII
ncbi:MAG: LON peptidase substrate-binding domain-containing protein, partial [Flavobacteriaceae bacterium]